MTIQELRDARKRAHEQAVGYLSKPNFDSEARSAYDKAMAEVDRLAVEIKKAENKTGSLYSALNVEDKGHQRSAAFTKWLKYGTKVLSEVEQRSLEFRDVSEGNLLQHIGTYAGLGYLVPTGFSDQVEQALKYYAPLADGSCFRLWETASGQPIPWPTSNDTTQSATIVGEAVTNPEGDPIASQVVFGAYKFSSGLVKASIELIQDSAFDIDTWLTDLFGIRFGRALENYLTNGTGSGQPTGILTAVTGSGATPIVAQGSSESTGGSQLGSNSIGYSDLVNLEHSVDPSYRRRARYMFHDQTLSSLQRILDKYGRPLWVPGIANNAPDMINGYPYTINQSMPQIAAGQNTVLFGDMTKYVVRKTKGFSVQQITERYAELGQVAYLGFIRFDGNLLDGGTHPVNYLQQHS